MRNIFNILVAAILVAGLILSVSSKAVAADKSFSDKVGNVNVGDVNAKKQINMPFLFWGGDPAFLWANGNSMETKPNSIYGKLGLNIKLTNGDNFVKQVQDAIAGKSPFVRGVFSPQLAMAAEKMATDPRTKLMVAFWMTKSTGGDVLIGRGDIRTAADLKGKKVVMQSEGPHEAGMNAVLKLAGLKWSDIEVVLVDDITGDKGPAEAFKKDSSISAAWVVSPDAAKLYENPKFPGAEGTVKGCHEVVSTSQMTNVIWDFMGVRKDFWDQHQDIVTKVAAGYLKAQEELTELRKAYDKGDNKAKAGEYKKFLQAVQDVMYGKELIPTLDDAAGLISDCTYVGWSGNVTFFTDKADMNSFDKFQAEALDLVMTRGHTSIKQGLLSSGIDWNSKDFVGYLAKTEVKRQERLKTEAVASEIEALNSGAMDERTLLPPFYITFEKDQSEFSDVAYAREYQKVVDMLGKFGGNCAIVIRGHTDNAKILYTLVKIGMNKKDDEGNSILKRQGTPGNWKYSYKGKVLDLGNTTELLKLIEEGVFDLSDAELKKMDLQEGIRELAQNALNLSKSRAEAVKLSLVKSATDKGIVLDKSQIQCIGVGFKEPFISVPRSESDSAQNRRVEFRLMKVSAETVKDYDF